MLNEALNKSNLNWQLTFHNPATPVMEGIIELHNYVIMCLILDAVFIVWFLARSLYLFRASKNSDQLKQNHDPLIETVWVMAPVFVLVAIAMPSFSLLYSMDDVLDPSLVVKVTPHEWFWGYELANSKGNTIQSMFKIQYASSKNSMPVIDISSAGLKINKMLWQIELIFKHILSDFLIINIQNSFLYKVLFKLLSITFRDSPLLEKVVLNGFSFITAESEAYFAKFQSKVIAAMKPNFNLNSYLCSKQVFFFHHGTAKPMCVFEVKFHEQVIPDFKSYYQIKSKQLVLPMMQNLAARGNIVPRFEQSQNVKWVCPVNIKINNQKGFDMMWLLKSTGLKEGSVFKIGMGENKSKSYGLISETYLQGLSRESQIKAARLFFKALAEFDSNGINTIEHGGNGAMKLIKSNALLADYLSKTNGAETLKLIRELKAYYVYDVSLAEVQVSGGVATRESLTVEWLTNRAKQGLDEYYHIQFVGENHNSVLAKEIQNYQFENDENA